MGFAEDAEIPEENPQDETNDGTVAPADDEVGGGERTENEEPGEANGAEGEESKPQVPDKEEPVEPVPAAPVGEGPKITVNTGFEVYTIQAGTDHAFAEDGSYEIVLSETDPFSHMRFNLHTRATPGRNGSWSLTTSSPWRGMSLASSPASLAIPMP